MASYLLDINIFAHFAVCHCISSCENYDLVWKYADWILECDQVLGVEVCEPELYCNVLFVLHALLHGLNSL